MRKRQWNNGPMMASVTVPSVLSIMILLAASSSVVDAKRGIVQFPEAKARNGVVVKTTYNCEGDQMEIACPAGETIRVVRANYGRFSIAVCNDHGNHDWSVNCHSAKSSEILMERCNGERICRMEVNSRIFGGDPCPATKKYVEVHYACADADDQSANGDAANAVSATTSEPLPPWLQNSGIWNDEDGDSSDAVFSSAGSDIVRKPILVEVAPVPTPFPPSVRIPITTPKPKPTTKGPLPTSTDAVRFDEANHLGRVSPSIGDGERLIYLNVPPDASTSSYCKAQIIRSVAWNWTRPGEMAIRPCPSAGGSSGSSVTGLARWQCDAATGEWLPAHGPDLGDCKSAELTRLEVAARSKDPEDVIASRLAHLTRQEGASPLLGGDLESALSVLRSVANRLAYRLQQETTLYNARSHVVQIYQNVLRSASQILSPWARPAWGDLRSDSERAKVAAELMGVLEANARVVADVLEDGETLFEKTREIVSYVTSSSEGANIPTWFGIHNDSVSLPSGNEFAFLSFKSLHRLMNIQPDNNNKNEFGARINSRVVSLSGRAAADSSSNGAPLKIRLKRVERRMAKDEKTVCVSWDRNAAAWSPKGCSLVDEDQEFSVCECREMSSFALMSAPTASAIAISNNGDVTSVTDISGAASDNMTADIVAYLVASILVVVLIIVVVQFRNSIRRACKAGTCCFCCCDKSSASNGGSASGKSAVADADKKVGLYTARVDTSVGNGFIQTPQQQFSALQNGGIEGMEQHSIIVTSTDNNKMRPNTATTLAAPPRRAPEPHPRTATTARNSSSSSNSCARNNISSSSFNIHKTASPANGHHTFNPSSFLSQLRSTGYSNGIISNSSTTSSEDLSTLPRRAAHQLQGQEAGSQLTSSPNRPGSSRSATVRVNPFPFTASSPARESTRQASQQPLPPPARGSSQLSADNYCRSQQGHQQQSMSPQLARLTRTLKRNSETPPNSSTTDSAYSTATINISDYQNVMTVSDDNVYCEIASPAAAAYAHQIPTFVGGHHRHPKPRYPYHHHAAMANDNDDTASDVHNLTDFSDDEDPLRQHHPNPNSPRIIGTAKARGSWYGDDHDQSPSRRQLLNYRSPILQSGGRLS